MSAAGIEALRAPTSRRRRAQAIAAVLVVAISYGLSALLHRRALLDVEMARQQMAGADWLGAIATLDRVRWEDPFLAEVSLLRGRAINEHLGSAELMHRRYSWDDALADLDRYLRDHPESGEAHFQRGLSLVGRGRVEPAVEAMDRAIHLLPDPSEALVVRAGLSFHARDYEGAERAIGGAIERHPLVPEYYDERAFYRRVRGDLGGARADRVRAGLLRESIGLTVEQLEASAKARLDDRPISTPQDSPVVASARARLLGRWDVAIKETEGEPERNADPDYYFAFEPHRYRLIHDGDVKQEGPFWLDGGRIDCDVHLNGKPSRLLGIYEIDGEILRIGLASPGEARPHDFKTQGSDTTVVYTLRRAGPPAPPGRAEGQP